MARADDWYRSDDWSEEAQAIFEAKLRRSRSDFNRAQYITLKALALIRSNDADRIDAACVLLDRVIAKYPAERAQVFLAHWHLADAHRRCGRLCEAEAEYRECIGFEPAHLRSDGGQCVIELAEMLLASHQADKYEELLSLLDDIVQNPVLIVLRFNSNRFRILVIAATILDRRGDTAAAARAARDALDLATITEPQLPRHPTVGVVQASPETLREMRRIAGLSD